MRNYERCNVLRKYKLTILVLWCTCQTVHALEQPHHHVGFYIENFGGRLDPETLPDVYEVFAKIRSVAEMNDRDLPQLVVIKDLPGPPAFVLPDGNLVLTQQALDIIYNGVPLWEGNTRLAFVLGHELAHLASDDSWSTEVKHLIQSKALSGEIDGSILEQIEHDKKDLIERELKADDKGFLYAAMAGFPVEVLLAHENDFLSYWVAETHTQSSKTHPEAIQRTNLLSVRLQQKKDALEFFYMGVRLAYFGRHQDAVYFFQEFQEVFPGREVFNNLGVCYLQMAVKKMPPTLAYQYWLPRILDNETIINRSDVLPVFRDRKQIKIAKDFLEQAVRYLTIATEKDPAYRIGYINLAVSYFYLDEIYLRALILFKEGQPIDTWSYAEEIFSALANDHASDALPLSIYYNWARLLEVRSRSAESQWQKLTKHINELPWPIAQILCKRLKNSSAIEKCLKEINQPDAKNEPTFPELLPIQLGFDAWQLKKAEHPLHNWQKLPFHWRGEAANSGIIYHGPQDDIVLEMDGVVEMVVLRKNLGQLKDLLQKCGPPQHKQKVMNNELWSYGHWCVLLEQDRIKEFWVVRAQL